MIYLLYHDIIKYFINSHANGILNNNILIKIFQESYISILKIFNFYKQ